MLVSIVLAYVVWFAVRIYPLLPYSLGGGKPLPIVFIEGEKPLPDGIMAGTTPKRSVPYKLLVETDKSFIVLSPGRDEESIEVGRECVAGVIVLQDRHNP